MYVRVCVYNPVDDKQGSIVPVSSNDVKNPPGTFISRREESRVHFELNYLNHTRDKDGPSNVLSISGSESIHKNTPPREYLHN